MIPLTAMTVFFTTELLKRPVFGALRWAGCVVTVATRQRYAHYIGDTQVNPP